MRKPKQKEIWVVHLGETQGKEHAGPHHCVILQRDELNDEIETTVVLPLMRNNPWHHPNPEYAIRIKPTKRNKLDVERWADVSQIRCVAYLRLKDGYAGALDDEDFWELEAAFYATFGTLFGPPPPCPTCS